MVKLPKTVFKMALMLFALRLLIKAFMNYRIARKIDRKAPSDIQKLSSKL